MRRIRKRALTNWDISGVAKYEC